MTIAKGQDTQADNLLYNRPKSLKIFIPHICYNDIMDNIILQSILYHAQLYPQEDKAFISNNSNDFGKPEVKEVLSNAGIRYFTITQHFLDWFNSRSSI